MRLRVLSHFLIKIVWYKSKLTSSKNGSEIPNCKQSITEKKVNMWARFTFQENLSEKSDSFQRNWRYFQYILTLKGNILENRIFDRHELRWHFVKFALTLRRNTSVLNVVPISKYYPFKYDAIFAYIYVHISLCNYVPERICSYRFY